MVYSLDNAPSGATIDPDSGKFVWTPTSSHGNIQDVHYSFDVIANSGSQEDKDKVIITVKKAFEEPTITYTANCTYTANYTYTTRTTANSSTICRPGKGSSELR